MKSFAALLCLASLALNTALGFAGSMLFCEHETGDSHLVSKAAHATATHDEWCHSRSAPDRQQPTLACDSCTDTEIESRAAFEETTTGFERIVVKSPPAFKHTQLGAHFTFPLSLSVEKFRLAQVVPVAPTAASQQFTDTIQFRC